MEKEVTLNDLYRLILKFQADTLKFQEDTLKFQEDTRKRLDRIENRLEKMDKQLDIVFDYAADIDARLKKTEKVKG